MSAANLGNPWSFTQVGNSFRELKEYEHIRLIRSRNGMANQYRLAGGYTGVDFMHTILTAEGLEERMKSGYRRSERKQDEVRERKPAYLLSA